jgi:hypothetical protein
MVEIRSPVPHPKKMFRRSRKGVNATPSGIAQGFVFGAQRDLHPLLKGIKVWGLNTNIMLQALSNPLIAFCKCNDSERILIWHDLLLSALPKRPTHLNAHRLQDRQPDR